MKSHSAILLNNKLSVLCWTWKLSVMFEYMVYAWYIHSVGTLMSTFHSTMWDKNRKFSNIKMILTQVSSGELSVFSYAIASLKKDFGLFREKLKCSSSTNSICFLEGLKVGTTRKDSLHIWRFLVDYHCDLIVLYSLSKLNRVVINKKDLFIVSVVELNEFICFINTSHQLRFEINIFPYHYCGEFPQQTIIHSFFFRSG